MNKLYLRNRLCIPVKGYNRSIIYDLMRNDYYFIPNELFDLIETNEVISFDVKQKSIVDEWVHFLLEEEIIFEIFDSKERVLFPDVNTSFQTPFLITDVLIHDSLSNESIGKIDLLDTRNISIIINQFNPETIKPFLEKISLLEVDSICLFLTEENITYNYSCFKKLAHINQIFNVYLFKSSCKYDIDDNNIKLINAIELPYTFEEYTQFLSPEKLRVNYDHFFESFNHHSYYNKKLYIDEKGNIKNGIISNTVFANINTIDKKDFMSLINSTDFQKLWSVKKQDTVVCNECEFRYMCMDSRVPSMSINNTWFHDMECTYNPYISKWKNEEGYKLLSEVGINIQDDTGDFSIDREKLVKSFDSIWN